LLPSIGPADDPRLQPVSPQVTKPSTQRQAAITFCQACGYLPSWWASPSISQYQIILLGDRSTRVWTTCPRLLHDSTVARARIRDQWVTSPMP